MTNGVPTSTSENNISNILFFSHYESMDLGEVNSLDLPPLVTTKHQDSRSSRTKDSVSRLARFEGMTRRRRKTPAEKAIEKQSEFYKYEFVVKDSSVLLDGKAPDTRLTAMKGANRKRARSVDLSAFNQLYDLHNTTKDKEPDARRTGRCYSEEIQSEECAQGRYLPAGDQSSAEHDADDMSPGSSENKRNTRNSSHWTDIPSTDPLGGADTTATLDDGRLDSADQIVGLFSPGGRGCG